MKRPLFYLPSLHRAIAPAGMPGEVLFFPPGLSEEKASIAKDFEETFRPAILDAVRNALPLGAKEASFVLGEMLGMGDACADKGFLRQLYANHAFVSGRSKGRGAPGEFADLAVFAATGDVPDKASPSPSPGHTRQWYSDAQKQSGLEPAIRQALIDCQKVLLLVWWREEKLLELAALEQRFLTAEEALHAALADGVGDAATKPASAPAPEDTGVPWRVIMDAALPFLPDEAAIFTADTPMALDLRDAGILSPLPEDSADVLSGWPQELVSGLLHAELPAWRLVGRKNPLDERPWLERKVEVFVARPQRGWAEGGTILKVNE